MYDKIHYKLKKEKKKEKSKKKKKKEQDGFQYTDGLKTMWYIHMMEYFPMIKINELSTTSLAPTHTNLNAYC